MPASNAEAVNEYRQMVYTYIQNMKYWYECYMNISVETADMFMAQCKTAVTPLLKHLSNYSLALRDGYICCTCMKHYHSKISDRILKREGHASIYVMV